MAAGFGGFAAIVAVDDIVESEALAPVTNAIIDRYYREHGGVNYEPTADGKCTICMTNPSTHVCLPCRHKCLCEECSVQLLEVDDRCPICRRQLRGSKFF